MAADSKQPIIVIKKVSGHGGAHGGAWKVAFADFVTAMMALFMVLWLVNSASVQTRERIASYFKQPGIFETGSGTPLQIGGAGILPDTFAPPGENSASQIVSCDATSGSGGGPCARDAKDLGDEEEEEEDDKVSKASGQASEQMELQKIAEELNEELAALKESVKKYLGQVEVKVDQRGLHIEIMDTKEASMFKKGDSSILPEAEAQLTKISEILGQLPNPIDIEGHTDSTPFKGRTNYDNWDLSTDRANSARRILSKKNIGNAQIARVVGFAETRPKLPEDAKHASNRRISISMRFTEQAKLSLLPLGAVETKSSPIRKQGASAPQTAEQAKALLNSSGAQNTGSLNVEVSTRVDPDSVVSTAGNEGPAWLQKDLIFGNQNPFE